MIPEDVNSIGSNAFGSGYNLTSVVIANDVITIGDFVFAECKNLKTIEIGDNVTTIGDNILSNCRNVSSVKIGKSVTKIGREALFCWSAYMVVRFNGTIAEWEAIEKGYQWVCTIYVERVYCIDGNVLISE